MRSFQVWARVLAACGVLMGLVGVARADQTAVLGATEVAVPSDAKFSISLDLAALRKTQFGDRLLTLTKEKILEELAKESKNNDEVSLDKINAVLGFDPFENIQRIWVFGSAYQRAKDTAVAVIDLKETTGNLEGLMLAMPGYRSKDFNGTQIHSATPDGKQRLSAAIQNRSGAGRRIVITSEESTLESLLANRTSTGGAEANPSRSTNDDHGVLNLFLRELPAEEIGEGPHANVARIIDQLDLSVSEVDNALNVTMSLTAKKPEQAEQLRQMTQGLLAAMQFAQAMEPDDEDLRTVAALLQDTKTEQEDNTTKVSMRLASDKILELIERELD